MAALRLVGSAVLGNEANGWLEWTDLSPLVAPAPEALDLTELERRLEQDLGALEAACQRPKSRLATDEERQLVARCKRPSSRAAPVLAARSEDWERRTLWGVRPKRVLGLVREDVLDIYENRVAVTLVDHLDNALRRHLRTLRRALVLLRSKLDFQNVVDGSDNYRRVRRITRLWAEADSDSTVLEAADETRKRVIALHRRVLALKDSALYREIGRTTSARTRLRMTNLLSHDDVYRRVAALWRAWDEHKRGDAATPGVRWQRDQEAARGIDRFLALVVIRALEVLGFEPDDESFERPLPVGGSWALNGPVGGVMLRRDEDAVVVEFELATAPLRCVAVPAMLEAGVSLDKWLERQRSETPQLVAWVSTEENRGSEAASNRLHSLGNLGECDATMFASIAPWDIQSVERVTRALRWYLWAALYRAYPFKLPSPDARNLPTTRQFQTIDGRLAMPVPLALHKQLWPELGRELERVEAELSSCREKKNELDEIVRVHKSGGNVYRSSGRRNSAVRNELKDLKRTIQEREVHREALRSARAAAEGVLADSQLLLVCPSCNQSGSVREFRGDGRTFAMKCDGCKATWGLDACSAQPAHDGECRALYPYFEVPSSDGRDPGSLHQAPVDSDILAVPEASGSFVCPECGLHTDGSINP